MIFHNEDVTQSEAQLSNVNNNEMQDIPIEKIYGVNLKIHPEVKKITMNNDSLIFIKNVKKALNIFNPDENHYNERLILFAMQSCENFFLHKKSGETKQEMVVQCVLEFFNNDKELIKKFIQLLMPKLINFKFVRRNFYKIVNFFSKLFSTKACTI
jgi:hypothetical protein